MDMRSKAYPALPDGRGLRLVIPRAGDLRFRPQIPATFSQRLYIHADPRRRFWYARFQVRRKFIVMSTQGDLYAKTSVATFTMADLPKKNVLSMPRVARGDLVKVLDLVQCSRSEGQQWELVFARWRNGMETWLPLEVAQLYATNLLQEFYVNSVNSWAFHSRLQPESLLAFRTEVELWLFHTEFQEFYKRLRQKRASGSTVAQAQQQSSQTPDRVPVKPERPTAPVHTSLTPSAPRPVQAGRPPAPVTTAESDPSEAVIQGFEQRRLAREHQERQAQLDHERQQRLLQAQQQRQHRQRIEQQAEEQRRLQRERKERERQVQEQESARRLQHEQQRQKAHDELQRSQKEYQQRLRAQREREERADLQQQEQERQQRAKEQEQLRRRLQQDKPQKKQPVYKQVPTRRQEATTRTQLCQKERQAMSDSHTSSSQRDSEDSDPSADSESSEDSFDGRLIRKRRRKRLLYSQVELDDDDDDLPDLSQPPPATRRRNTREDNSDDDPLDGKRVSKRRRRLRQPDSNGRKSKDVEVDLTQLSDEDEDSVDLLTENGVNASVEPSGGGSGSGTSTSELADENGDVDLDDDMDFEPFDVCVVLHPWKDTVGNGYNAGKKIVVFGSMPIAEDLALVGMGDLDSNFPIHYVCQAINRYTVEICRMILAAQPSMLRENDTERIERMEGLLLSSPFLLRLDNKMDYVWRYIIQSIKKSRGHCPLGVENGKLGAQNQSRQKKLAFTFSRKNGCFWKQFVSMGMQLEPEDFRLPIIFSIERGNSSNQGVENREGNLKLVLVRLAAGLLREVPGLLERSSSDDLEKTPLSSDKEELAAQLLGFFMLGELIAHFVLYAVPLSGILDFTAAFLRCIGCKGKYRLARDKAWENAGRSFAAGFEAVLPATLDLFRADELRVLFNGPDMSLNAMQIDWNTAVNWNMSGHEVIGDKEVGSAKTWLPRLINELVEEEQQLVLLFMTGTFQLVNERFFRAEGNSGRITVESFLETDGMLDHDKMYPSMEHKAGILRLPSYSCYEAFKKGMLAAIRYTNQAFLPE
ncbi:hypothetical protein PInf_024424 [Phytophthora infestans]|nr:hypothetical protein PInf_024424 [Phytophthora infestans]